MGSWLSVTCHPGGFIGMYSSDDRSASSYWIDTAADTGGQSCCTFSDENHKLTIFGCVNC